MRFPNVDWWCDECTAFLADQQGFTDESDEWICAICGHSTPIAADNVLSDEQVARAEEWLSNFDPKNYLNP
ncbi:hypothetical protein AB2L57_01910 [Microbacterium sp. HA-8]|uniref:hypothetical protein n=1 Tax=Microbacterium sp. HA-8 TaxID=3234200 RepID=UPI0038F6E52E